MKGTKQHPFSFDELLDILRKEQNIPKYSFIQLASFKHGTKFVKFRQNSFWQTHNMFVYLDNNKYQLTKKTIESLGIRSTCGKTWPINFKFDKIERKCYNLPDFKEYATNDSYKMCEGGGWYSNCTLYCKDGKYYA